MNTNNWYTAHRLLRDRVLWREAHRLLPQLRATRSELRDALSHLGKEGLASLLGDDKTTFDLRRAVGPHWFDEHYSQKGLL